MCGRQPLMRRTRGRALRGGRCDDRGRRPAVSGATLQFVSSLPRYRSDGERTTDKQGEVTDLPCPKGSPNPQFAAKTQRGTQTLHELILLKEIDLAAYGRSNTGAALVQMRRSV